MSPFECVPNFSEGRDPVKLERIVGAGRAVPGVTVLDVERNADHNRAVVSLVGEGDALLEGVFRMIQVAAKEIDLTQHRGEHPRMGATDVVPFVPLGTATMAEAVRLAERLGERVARELSIPVYLYAAAARRPERADLARVREGQFEGLRDAIGADPARAPDFGEPRIHPTAGAVAITYSTLRRGQLSAELAAILVPCAIAISWLRKLALPTATIGSWPTSIRTLGESAFLRRASIEAK